MLLIPMTTHHVSAASSAFTALIWWLVPLAGVIGALGYVAWISQFKRKFEKGTSRSVNQFERFQNSFRDDDSQK
jgi:type II secretory pathway component PulF